MVSSGPLSSARDAGVGHLGLALTEKPYDELDSADRMEQSVPERPSSIAIFLVRMEGSK